MKGHQQGGLPQGWDSTYQNYLEIIAEQTLRQTALNSGPEAAAASQQLHRMAMARDAEAVARSSRSASLSTALKYAFKP